MPALVLAGAGVAFLVMAGWDAWHLASFLRHAEHAAGIVVDAHQHQRVRFTAADGTVVEFVQNGSLNRVLDAPVPVAYDPADPAGTAIADTFWATWWQPLSALLGGLCFFAVSAFRLRRARTPGR